MSSATDPIRPIYFRGQVAVADGKLSYYVQHREIPPVGLDRALYLLLWDSVVAPFSQILASELMSQGVRRLADTDSRKIVPLKFAVVPEAVRDRFGALLAEAANTGSDSYLRQQ